MTESLYQLIESGRGVPIKAWTRGVLLEPEAGQQLRNVASLPIVYKWVAAMLDVHWGIGATIGSLIPTKGVECRKDKDVIDETPGVYKADSCRDVGSTGPPGHCGYLMSSRLCQRVEKGLAGEGQGLTFFV